MKMGNGNKGTFFFFLSICLTPKDIKNKLSFPTSDTSFKVWEWQNLMWFLGRKFGSV